MIEKEDDVTEGTDHMDRSSCKGSHDIRQQIPPAVADPNEEWVKEYIEQFGTPPSFF